MRLKAVLTAAVALLALAGCQKPVPDVGGRTGGPTPKQPREIRVRDGKAVGFDVPSELHHTPWVVVLSIPGSRTAQRSPYQVDRTHLSVTPDFSTSPRILAEIVAYSSDGRAVRPTGLWRFLLVRDEKP
jgi:hypothetical protein